MRARSVLRRRASLAVISCQSSVITCDNTARCGNVPTDNRKPRSEGGSVYEPLSDRYHPGVMPSDKRDRQRQNRAAKKKREDRTRRLKLVQRRLVQAVWFAVIVAAIVTISNLIARSNTSTTTTASTVATTTTTTTEPTTTTTSDATGLLPRDTTEMLVELVAPNPSLATTLLLDPWVLPGT